MESKFRGYYALETGNCINVYVSKWSHLDVKKLKLVLVQADQILCYKIIIYDIENNTPFLKNKRSIPQTI